MSLKNVDTPYSYDNGIIVPSFNFTSQTSNDYVNAPLIAENTDTTSDNELTDLTPVQTKRRQDSKPYARKRRETRPNHPCEQCHKVFKRPSELRRHEFVHSGVKPFACSTCNMAFSLAGNLRQHELIHTGFKPHSCEQCGKGFTQVGSLRQHLLTHSGTRPHECDICQKGFTRPSILKEHKRVNHPENSELTNDVMSKMLYINNQFSSKRSDLNTYTPPENLSLSGSSYDSSVSSSGMLPEEIKEVAEKLANPKKTPPLHWSKIEAITNTLMQKSKNAEFLSYPNCEMTEQNCIKKNINDTQERNK